jgi:hypothetical protein
MSYQRILIVIFGAVLLVSCGEREPKTQVTPSITVTTRASVSPTIEMTPATSETPSLKEQQLASNFAQIVPGITTRQNVIEMLGEPTTQTSTEGEDNLWYDPPSGWITIINDRAVAKTAFVGKEMSLEQIIEQNGAPERVVQIIRAGHYGRSSTWLLYPQSNLALELPGELDRFDPHLRPHGTETSPAYFAKFIQDQGLNGTPLYEVKTITWPGLSN